MNDLLLENTGLKERVLEQIQSVLSLHPEVEKAILYGSRAKGNFKPYSDIDLSLLGSQLTLTILQKIEMELDDLLLPYTIDLSIFEKISNTDLQDHIKKWGKVFYSKTQFE